MHQWYPKKMTKIKKLKLKRLTHAIYFMVKILQ